MAYPCFFKWFDIMSSYVISSNYLEYEKKSTSYARDERERNPGNHPTSAGYKRNPPVLAGICNVPRSHHGCPEYPLCEKERSEYDRHSQDVSPDHFLAPPKCIFLNVTKLSRIEYPKQT